MSNKSKGTATGAASGAAAGFMVGGVWGAAVGGVLGGISGALSGGAADDAEKLAEMQMKYEQVETAENLRRMRLQAEYALGAADASVFASNLQMTGSSKGYIDAMETQFTSDRAWVKESSRLQLQMIKAGGAAAADNIMTSLYTQQAVQLGTAAVSYYTGNFGDIPKAKDLPPSNANNASNIGTPGSLAMPKFGA